jgi:two-component system sensor histidine kinase HydH
MSWVRNLSGDELATFVSHMDSQELLFLAVTDISGKLVASSVPGQEYLAETFQNPDPPQQFPPPGPPHWRTSQMPDKSKVFWVYRPLWSTFESPSRGRRHTMDHPRQEPDHKGPDLNAPMPLYCWAGFDMGPFEAAAQSARANTVIFSALMALAGLGGLMALFWAHNSRLTRRLYQDSNALASEIIARLPVGLILNDSQGQVTLVNQAALKISGLSQEDFAGRRLSDVTFGAFPTDSELNGLEMDICFQGGHCALLSLTGGPVLGQGGTYLGRVILMADLGELGRLKAELAEKERLASLGSVAAGLAHEIRNPLGAIKGLTQHLMARAGDQPEREALEVMLKSVERLAGTITSFLEYAKPTEIEPSPLDLGPFLEKIQALVGHDAQSSQAEMTLEIEKPNLVISGDEGRLGQAFLNLYLNAIQAVSTNPPDRPGRLMVSLSDSGGRLAVISFSDNGPGFSQEQLARPFVPYFTSKAEGSGLGLALTSNIISAHQGQIQLGNRPEGGALVTVRLPLYPGESPDGP